MNPMISNPTIARPGRLKDAAKLCGESYTWMRRHWRELVDHARITYLEPPCLGGHVTLDLADVDSHIRRCVREGRPLLPKLNAGARS